MTVTDSRSRARRYLMLGTSALGAGVVVLAAPLWAQDAGPANEIRFGVSTTLRHDSNQNLSLTSPNRITEWVTGLSFGTTWQSPTSQFDLSISSELRAEDTPTNSGISADIPSLRAYYQHDALSARITAQARLDETDLSTLSLLVDPVTGEISTVEDPGRRRAFSLGTTVAGGLGGPLETSLGVTRSGTRYVDTISPSYYDTDSLRLTASAKAMLTPLVTMTTSLGYTDYEAQDANSTRRETTTAQVSFDMTLDKVTTLNAGLGYSRIEQTGAATLRNQTGATYSLGITRDHRTGTVGLSYSRNIDNNGPRDVLSLTGQTEMPRGQLSGTLSYNSSSQFSDAVTASLDYQQQLPGGQITLGASRAIATTDAGFDQLTTQIRAGWSQELTARAQLGLQASYSAVDTSAPGGTDTSRTTLGVSYDYQLTPDWTLTSGVQHRLARRAGQADATSNAVYVTLSRDYSFRF